MKRRIITTLLAIALMIPFVSPASYAAYDPLASKDTYYTAETDYIDGDCILTATRMMIRRAAIMHNRSDWDTITNESLRTEATMDGLLLYTFDYSSDGVLYTVESGTFSGEGDAARIAEFEQMLKEHPEGIVVHGEYAASTGTHGVLVTDVVDGEVYAMDSSYNMGMFSEGIQKWSDTTMLAPSLSTNYWYISEIEVTDIPVEMNPIRALHFDLLRLRITSV